VSCGTATWLNVTRARDRGRDTRATDQGEGPRVERPSLSGQGEERAAWASSSGRPLSDTRAKKRRPRGPPGLRGRAPRTTGKELPGHAIRSRPGPHRPRPRR
jgi:hypothetical protein